MDKKSVLFIDDEENLLHAIRRELFTHGYNVFTAINAEEAFTILDKYEVGVVVSDQLMPCVDGATLLSRIKKKYPKSVRIIMSGNSDFETLQRAINIGEIFKFIPKPCDKNKLIKELDIAFSVYQENEKKFH